MTPVLKGAEHLQLPLKSEESAFGDSTPYETESTLKNKLLSAKPWNVLLCVGNKSHVQLEKIFSGLAVFQYVLNLLHAWERSWQYTMAHCMLCYAMLCPKILTSLVSAAPFTLFLCSARAGKAVLPCHVISPPPRCSAQRAGDVEERMKRVGARACVNILRSYRSDTFLLHFLHFPTLFPRHVKRHTV